MLFLLITKFIVVQLVLFKMQLHLIYYIYSLHTFRTHFGSVLYYKNVKHYAL